MTLTDAPATNTSGSTADVVDEIRAWLADNWDPELTVGEWWERLGTSGWSAPTLPIGRYGKGLSRSDAVKVSNEIQKFGALGAPGGLGLLLAAPTIADHGTDEQVETYVRDIVTGKQAWCQLFSEPGAGSDLAGLSTKGMKDGDEWIFNGQKVWTSTGSIADMGMLIARTNVDVPKHSGITWFAIDMHQPGMDVRPLYEMTGHAMFNEVFISDARTPDSAVIGGLNNGWAVANTTLSHERSGLGAGGGGGGFGAQPGTVVNQLGKRAGDFAPKNDGSPSRRSSPAQRGSMQAQFAKGNGKNEDPIIRQQLAKLHTITELGRMNNERLKAYRAGGKDIPGMANISKLMMSDMVRLQRDLGLSILGAHGMLHAYNDEQKKVNDEATKNPFIGMITGTALYAQAPPIYGGTDQIQRNIIGERVLGLPKEPNDDKTKTFAQLPKNA